MNPKTACLKRREEEKSEEAAGGGKFAAASAHHAHHTMPGTSLAPAAATALMPTPTAGPPPMDVKMDLLHHTPL